MTIFIIIAIIIVGAFVVFRIIYGIQEKQPENLTDNQQESKLLDLNTTTVAQRQRAYNHGFKEQLQYDELQRRAETAGDTATLEAIRLGTYDGPLPVLNEEKPISAMSKPKSNPDASVQKLKYFCVKDKCYHVSVWPKDQGIGDYIEFNIAGISHRANIDDYLGEFKGTLEAEPTNTYDANAIKVLANDGHHVGYVPKDQTQYVRDFTTLPCTCYCYIGNNDGIYFSDCYVTQNNP